MIELQMRSKMDENCPEDLLRSVSSCVEQTLRFCYNHHRLYQLNQKDKLRLLFKIANSKLQKLKDYVLDFWLTEFGCNNYFMLVDYHYTNTANGYREFGRLYLKVKVSEKVSSLQENSMLTLCRHTRGKEVEEMRKLKLPGMLLEKMIEFKIKDEQ